MVAMDVDFDDDLGNDAGLDAELNRAVAEAKTIHDRGRAAVTPTSKDDLLKQMDSMFPK